MLTHEQHQHPDDCRQSSRRRAGEVTVAWRRGLPDLCGHVAILISATPLASQRARLALQLAGLVQALRDCLGCRAPLLPHEHGLSAQHIHMDLHSARHLVRELIASAAALMQENRVSIHS